MREYWFQISWSTIMVGMGIWLSLDQGFAVGMFAFGMAFIMSLPPIRELYDRCRR